MGHGQWSKEEQMTVFLGPRTNYQLSRYQLHSKFAWITLIALAVLCVAPVALMEEKTNKWLFGAPIAAGVLTLSSKNGRKMNRRLVSETFYGCLFTFTGVFSKGGGNSSK